MAVVRAASGGEKTDVSRERGGSSDFTGPLMAYVVPHKILLGFQRRACRARVVRLAVGREADCVVKHCVSSDFRKSA